MRREPGLRVVHLPARTPYVWKLHGPDFWILNNTENGGGARVPVAVTAAWLLEHRPLDWLDVLHLHHIEFENQATLADLLDACAREHVQVVFTAHDVHPMFVSKDDFVARLRILASAGVSFVCLTHGSASTLTELLDEPIPATVIPHGYVAAPAALSGRERAFADHPGRYLMFGAARPNRDQVSIVVNWSLGNVDPDASLHLLLRAFSPADFADPASQVPMLLNAVRADRRIRATMRPYPTDEEVIDAGLAADALLLPYLWGNHSGQLELAFDLNMLPVCSTAGYFHEQYELHKGLVDEPEWFDWSDGHPYLYGEKFLAAVERAAERLRAGRRPLDPEFINYRREEHERILCAYAEVYGGQ